MIEIPRIETGTSMIVQKKIEEEDTALNYGSGQLESLFATPSLVALMIEAAVKAVDHQLPEGTITIGKTVQVTHEKPTVLGSTVNVKVEVIGFDGARILFDMVAYDETGVVGKGKHERVIVNKKALLEEAAQRTEIIKTRNY